jgi:hypothetical protein
MPGFIQQVGTGQARGTTANYGHLFTAALRGRLGADISFFKCFFYDGQFVLPDGDRIIVY